MDTEKKYLIAFSKFGEKIGPRRFKKLLDFFGSAETAWHGSKADFIQAGLEEKITEDFFNRREKTNIEQELEKLIKEKISVLFLNDKKYPKQLKEIPDPPILLYVKGELLPEDEFSIAIVGTRKPSLIGKQATDQLANELSQTGLTIISGLAVGIDTIAHYAVLRNNKRTIAVIGSGLDRSSIYPAINKNIAEKIAENGAVISEYPLGAAALPHHFLARNRIISGLSLGTLVIEAKEKSGALITARYALEQNREVFAIPGSIYSENSKGTNSLIKSGAKLVQETDDILEELNPSSMGKYRIKKEVIAETPEEEKILALLSGEPTHIDKIVNKTTIDTASVNSTLIIMELKGKVKNVGNMMYVKL